ncbi:MAG TPA: hypothetical protein VGR55_05685 [Candidatus Acidoferrum sp.]|nr:hypothetical protein [Candidatus Acidoferrum sp.]
MTEFVVLGVGSDPRIYGSSPVSSLEVEEAAMQYMLTYPDHPVGLGLGDFVLEFLAEGAIELLFSLLDFLV